MIELGGDLVRYVIVAFFFLGLVFYEMSGGADFDADATRLSRIEAPLTAEPEKLEQVFAGTDSALTENVTRAALNLNTVQDVVRPVRTNRTTLAPAPSALDAPGVAVSTAPPAEFFPSLVGDSLVDTNILIDRSAITVVDFSDNRPAPLQPPARAQPETPEVATDIRSVTGAAVNVRGGPGTNFSVVNRLVLGDEVEVLQDPGEGWVQLRPLNGSPTGWMASYLLTDG